MKSMTLFVFVASLTACLSYSSRSVVGADPKTALERPIAVDGKAILDECEVTGQLVRKDDGVYAVLNCTNTTDHAVTVQFHCGVHYTPASTPLMRMLPRPSTIHREYIECRLLAGKASRMEILVRKEARPIDAKDAEAESSMDAGLRALNPPSWSLAISREEITDAAGWGGSAPLAAGSEGIVLERGMVVLTGVLRDAAKGKS